MKLATLRLNSGPLARDGELIVASADGQYFVSASRVAPHLQAALDDWDSAQPELQRIYDTLNANPEAGRRLRPEELCAPLPRAYEWLDASAYLSHIELVRRARGAPVPATLKTEPLVYQGGSGHLLGPRATLQLRDPQWGLDFEGEVCAILADVEEGSGIQTASSSVRLLMLANDVSLRNLIGPELSKGFGFVHSKPATAFSPFAVTPDELGSHWQNGRVNLPLRCLLNGTLVGEVDAGAEMHFSFFDLISHIVKTRQLTAGTILGSGTVSRTDPSTGACCLAEKRTRELIDTGAELTPFMAAGDVVQIEMFDTGGHNVFGSIVQQVA